MTRAYLTKVIIFIYIYTYNRNICEIYKLYLIYIKNSSIFEKINGEPRDIKLYRLLISFAYKSYKYF